MRIIDVNDSEAFSEACRVLVDGGIVAHATETCYGLACDLTNPKTVERLFRIKKRPANQPVSALFASVEEAKTYVEWSEKTEELAENYLPGPLTIVLDIRHETGDMSIFPVPKSQISNLKSIGIRISSHPVAQKLVKEFGKPLSTTSANIHGQPSPYSMEHIVEADLILDSGKLPHRKSSTVVKVVGNTVTILREGEVTITY